MSDVMPVPPDPAPTPAPAPDRGALMSADADLDDLWQRCLVQLQNRLTGPAHRAWLDDTRIVGHDSGTVVLAAPHNLAREQITGRYSEEVRAALANVTGEDLRVVVIVALDADPAPVSDADPDPAAAAAHPPRPRAPWGPEEFSRPAGDRDGALNDKYTFERFVIGASNRFAHAAAFAVAEAPANAYNPLFVYGHAGLGKTHLLQAVGHYTTTLYPQLRCRYVTSEQFTNEFIDAISNGRQVAFQRRYRDVDVLLIDDIQFLQSKERTQEEFFHTFNALHTADKQIVISSDRPPKEIGHLEERLETRFKMGLITDIQPPDLETRLAILRKKSAQEGLLVPADVLDLIASNIESNIRELEGALIRVIAHASLERTKVELKMAEWVLKDIFADAQDTAIGVGLIKSETADYFRLSVEELCSASRTRQLVNARQIAMYITRELTELSLPKIGQEFGGRDHTTVMHATKKISALIKERPSVFKQVQELTSRVKTTARRPQ